MSSVPRVSRRGCWSSICLFIALFRVVVGDQRLDPNVLTSGQADLGHFEPTISPGDEKKALGQIPRSPSGGGGAGASPRYWFVYGSRALASIAHKASEGARTLFPSYLRSNFPPRAAS